MFKLPQSVIYAMVGVNITGFTLLLQLDMLIFNPLWAKVIAWLCTLAIWMVVYKKRKKFFILF